jgi:Reverse transcriptase (RNA-dependent DNA polymerase)
MDIYQELDRDFNEDIPQDEIEVVDEVPNENFEYDDEENQDDDIVKVIPTIARRVLGVQRESRNMTTFYNPNPGESTETAMLARVFNPTELIYVSTIHDGSPDPKNYVEAKNSKDWNKWWEAMCTEFKNMEDKKVWKVISKSDVPTGRKLTGNRWVFAQKDDGRYRARTVAKGFSQVPGKDFQENHAPVVNDATFHLVLALKVLFKLEAAQFDIETAFLYGELDQEIWMQLPDGYSEYCVTYQNKKIDPNTHCVRLQQHCMV